MSSIIDYEDRSPGVLFGDGAGAAVTSPATDEASGSSTSRMKSTAAEAPRCVDLPDRLGRGVADDQRPVLDVVAGRIGAAPRGAVDLPRGVRLRGVVAPEPVGR